MDELARKLSSAGGNEEAVIADTRSHGYYDAGAIEGGYPAWQRSGNPVEPVPREEVVRLPRFR